MKTEILMPPCTFEQILQAGQQTNLIDDKSVIILKGNQHPVNMFGENQGLLQQRFKKV